MGSNGKVGTCDYYSSKNEEITWQIPSMRP